METMTLDDLRAKYEELDDTRALIEWDMSKLDADLYEVRSELNWILQLIEDAELEAVNND